MHESTIRGHYIAVVRTPDGMEIDRGREHTDLDVPFEMLLDAVCDLDMLAEGFSDADARSWCDIRVEMTVWIRGEEGRKVLFEGPFWSSASPELGAKAPANLRQSLTNGGVSIEARDLARLLRAQVRASRLTDALGEGVEESPPDTKFHIADA